MDISDKTNLIGALLMDGAKAQLRQQWTWAAASAIGVYQGLNHRGGGTRTVLANGLAVLMVLAAGNGIYNVVTHWENIKDI